MVTIRNYLFASFLFLVCAGNARASHILGGGLSYTFIDSAGGNYHYKIRLTLYHDCRTGQPEAVAQDNPAFFTFYEGSAVIPFLVDTTVYVTSAAITIPVDYTTPCGAFSIAPTDFCAQKRIFEKDYYLPPSASGYTVVYQRCCRSVIVANLIDPGDMGITFSCNIPATHVVNTSAVYAENPPMVVCKDNALVYELSATDADGDSLSYEFSQCYNGTSSNDIKPPVASHPPFDPVNFISSYSYSSPMGSGTPISYNPVTGWLSINPDHLGVYLIGVSCHEWRGGVLVNTSTMEFNCMVLNCTATFASTFHPFAGNDTIVIVGDSLHFHATGGVSYTWEPTAYLNNPAIADPTGIFTGTGTVTYILHAINDTGCSGNDTVTVHIIDHAAFLVPNAFTPNGDNINDQLKPIPLKNATLKSLKIFDRSGKVVYNGQSPHDGWDGRYNGKEAGIGTYTWELQYNDEKGDGRIQTGNVTLLR